MSRPAFKGEYPADWPELARLVKAEAGYRCVRCGHRHDPKAGYTLTVHHFDGDRGNRYRWNLMALCQRCHLSIQSRVDPEIGLLFDPAMWAMPYIAGFYRYGRGVPPPGYDLSAWIDTYNTSGRTWPAWAVAPPPASTTKGIDDATTQGRHVI